MSVLDYKNMHTEIINNELNKYENNVNNDIEIKKKLYDECYYKKYHTALLEIKNKIVNYDVSTSSDLFYYKNEINDWTTKANWHGWGGNLHIVDGCSKNILRKFMYKYNLINPVTLVKEMLSDK